MARGHHVTAVVRDPAAHRSTFASDGVAAGGVLLVAGDVTSAQSVAALCAEHDAVISAAARLDLPSEQFFPVAARALLDGLVVAGVGRLVVIGIGTVLETAPGVPVYDAEGFPADARSFSLGHVAELDVLRAAPAGIDWLVLAPPPTMLDDVATRTGHYRDAETPSRAGRCWTLTCGIRPGRRWR